METAEPQPARGTLAEGHMGKLLFALFMALRAAMLLVPVTPTSDADWYYHRAAGLTAGLGYVGKNGVPTAFWPPGWPMILSLGFRVLGVSPLAVGLVNLGFAALAAWLTYDLARRISGSRRVGLIALALLAIYPNSILYVPLALTEVAYTTLLLAGCWLLVVPGTPWRTILAGLVFGLAMLVKAQTLLVVPLIFAIALLRQPQWRAHLIPEARRLAMVLGAAALVVAPWTIRNHAVLGHWVAVSTNGGITLLSGNNDAATGDYTMADPVITALGQRGLGEVEYDREAKRLGVAWIKAHPMRFAALGPRKLFRLWGPDGEGEWGYEGGSPAYSAAPGVFYAVRLANQVYYALLMLGFALAPVVIIRQRRRAGERVIDWWLLPYGVALYLSAIAVVFSGQSRFHYPVMPFVCMAVAMVLADAWRRHDRSARIAG